MSTYSTPYSIFYLNVRTSIIFLFQYTSVFFEFVFLATFRFEMLFYFNSISLLLHWRRLMQPWME